MGGPSPAASNRLKVETEKPPLLATIEIGSTMSSSVGGGSWIGRKAADKIEFLS
jgi:hypothetical protein